MLFKKNRQIILEIIQMLFREGLSETYTKAPRDCVRQVMHCQVKKLEFSRNTGSQSPSRSQVVHQKFY